MNLLDLENPDPVDWCERNIQLDYGRFDREKHPLIVDPLRAAADMRGGMVGLIGSVQHIKTLCAQLLHLYTAQTSPTRAAHYDLTKDALKEFSDDKFTPLLDSTEAIQRIIPGRRHSQTTYYTEFPYGFIRLLGARILAHRNSKTLEMVTLDESWAYDAGWIDQIKDRLSSYPWSWRMFLPTSGQTADSDLDVLWRRSTQRVWHVACDCCGETIPYIWTQPKQRDGAQLLGGMKFATGDDVLRGDGSTDYDAIRQSVYYECQECGGRMDYTPASVHRRNSAGQYVQQNENGEDRIDFYHYNSMSHFPWPDLACQFHDATVKKNRGDLEAIENFVRKRLSQVWDKGKYISLSDDEDSAGDYEQGQPWKEADYTFCTIDVQKDHYYFVIRKWTHGVESRLIEAHKAVSDAHIVEMCEKYAIQQDGMNGSGVFVDGNYNSVEVQRIAAKNGWIVLRGQNCKLFRHDDGTFKLYGEPQYIDTWQGTDTGEGKVKYCVQFWNAENEVRLKFATLRGIHEPKKLWTYPKDIGDNYIRQLNSWKQVAKKNAKDGSTYYDFIKTYRNDHFYDCEKMQIIAASMAGLIGMDVQRDENQAT
jgi:hypothetical protein